MNTDNNALISEVMGLVTDAIRTHEASALDVVKATVQTKYGIEAATIDSIAAEQRALNLRLKDAIRNNEVLHCRAQSATDNLGASKEWRMGEPVEFMWMPAGESEITAGFRDGAINVCVSVDAATAATVQASFEAWKSVLPKQRPFGCVEHREQEASVIPSAFTFRDDGVYMAAEPTALGVTNVNGKIHRSWSPSFTTDADYSKAVEKNGMLSFPDGVRGSRTNPARITGVDFCVGTLTNKPAFRNMSPVKAKQADAKPPLTSAEILASLAASNPRPATKKPLTSAEILAQLSKAGRPPVNQ